MSTGGVIVVNKHIINTDVSQQLCYIVFESINYIFTYFLEMLYRVMNRKLSQLLLLGLDWIARGEAQTSTLLMRWPGTNIL